MERIFTMLFLALVVNCFGADLYVNGTEITSGIAADVADATHITLAAADVQADDYYNGYGIQIISGTGYAGGKDNQTLITDYDSATNVATVSPAWNATAPVAGSGYKITVGSDENAGDTAVVGHALATMQASIAVAGNNTVYVTQGTYTEPLNGYLTMTNWSGDTCILKANPTNTNDVILSCTNTSYSVLFYYTSLTNATITIENIKVQPATYATSAITLAGINCTYYFNNVDITNIGAATADGFTVGNLSPVSNKVYMKDCDVLAGNDALSLPSYLCALGGFVDAENCTFRVDQDAEAAGYGVQCGGEGPGIAFAILTPEIGDVFNIKATNTAGVSAIISFTAADTVVANVLAGIKASADTAEAGAVVPWNAVDAVATTIIVTLYEESGNPMIYEAWAVNGGAADTQKIFRQNYFGILRMRHCIVEHIGNDISHCALFGNGSDVYIYDCQFINGNPEASIKCEKGVIINSYFYSTITGHDDAEKYPVAFRGPQNLVFENNIALNPTNNIQAFAFDENPITGTRLCQNVSIRYNIVQALTGIPADYSVAFGYPIVDYNVYWTTGANIAELGGNVTTIAGLQAAWGTYSPLTIDNDLHSIKGDPGIVIKADGTLKVTNSAATTIGAGVTPSGWYRDPEPRRNVYKETYILVP